MTEVVPTGAVDERLRALSSRERAAAVQSFDALYGEMERALWCLSQGCRDSLLERDSSPVVEELVWTVKSWWGVQGVRSEAKHIIAQALARLDWSEELFTATASVAESAAEDASSRVALLVSTSQLLGLERREYSLASKVLHWLLPWRIPVYDSFVRKSLRIPTDWDHPKAYREIALRLFSAVHDLDGGDANWMGSVEPVTPLRALDKCLWWIGGGSEGRAVVVRDPWRVMKRLGLRRAVEERGR